MRPGIDSRHTFSFGGYHDANPMGFRALQVTDDDHLEPGSMATASVRRSHSIEVKGRSRARGRS